MICQKLIRVFFIERNEISHFRNEISTNVYLISSFRHTMQVCLPLLIILRIPTVLA